MSRCQSTHRLDLFHLLILFGHGLHSFVFPLLKHPSSCGFLHHPQDFCSLHVEHFRDLSLHDQEVWVVDIQLDRLEQVLKSLKGGLVAV